MKRFGIILLVLTMIIVMSQSLVFAEDNFAVEIAGSLVEKEVKLSLKDLKEMPEEAQISKDYVYYSKTGEKTASVKGVSLSYLLKEKAGVTSDKANVEFLASDGYDIAPQALEDVFNEELKYVLAYEVDGKIIDNDEIENEEITVYRNVKEEGEFGTVFKLVNKINIVERTIEELPEDKTPLTDPTEEVTEATVFTDITEEYKFAETAIYELNKRKIIDGVGGGLYAPEKEFTREQFCKIIVAALGYDLKEYDGKFSDIASTRWSAPYIQAAVESGIFIGNPDGTFMPEKVISRQEMAVVAVRAAIAKEIVEQSKVDKFVMEKSEYNDKDTVADWAGNSVAWLEAQKVFSEIASEDFQPLKNVNRAEAALVVFKTLFSK